MKCPNCGADLADDKLYCENCGQEIQFVPDYEPEIEQSITETLSEIQLTDEDGVFGDEFGDYSEEGQYDEQYYSDEEYIDESSIEGFYDDNGVYFEGYYAENGEFILLGYYDENGEFVQYGPEFYEEYYDSSQDDGYLVNDALDSDLEFIDQADNSSFTNAMDDPKAVRKAELQGASKNGMKKPAPSKEDIKKKTSDKEKKQADKARADKEINKVRHRKRPLNPLESETYKRPEGLVNIKPPSEGPRLSHKLSDLLYDEMYDNEGLKEHLDSLGEEYDLDPFDDFAYEGYLLRKAYRFIKSSSLKWFILPVLALLVILIFLGVSKVTGKIKQNTSYDYQVQLSNEAAARGDYASAIDYLEKAINLKGSDLNINNNNTDLKYTLVDLYFKNNDEDSAILTLWDIVKAGDSNAPFAYRRILDFYIARNDYDTINQVLLGCTYQDVLDEYGVYMADVPDFSVPEGTYEDPFDLVLSNSIPGYIYYTTDGTEPTEESELYTAPIYLDLGIYRISAIFVNQYGIKSDVVSKMYTLDRRVPDAPKLMIEGGEYTSPEMIEVDIQPYTRVFYTTDGTVPTMDSTEYLSPLPMPIGRSRLTFVAYSTENVPGPYTEVEFNLNVDTPLDVQGIVTYLLNYDYRIGRAVDNNGFIAGNSQRYTYGANQAIVFNDRIYYIYTESLIDAAGNRTRTATLFLVDTVDGSIWTAAKDENNVISIGSQIPPEQYAPLPEENPEPENGGNDDNED